MCHWTLHQEIRFYSRFQIFLTGTSHLSLGKTIYMLIKLEGASAMITKTTMPDIIKSKKLIKMSQRSVDKVEGAEVGSRHLERSPDLRVPNGEDQNKMSALNQRIKDKLISHKSAD